MNQKELLEKAHTAYQEADYHQAIAHYQQIIQQAKSNASKATAHYQIGRCYLQLKEARKSIYHLVQAGYLQEELQEKAKVYFGLGKAYQELKDCQKAIDNYTQAIELYNTPADKAEAYLQRGRCYQAQREYRAAVQNYRTAYEHFTTPEDKKKAQAQEANAQEMIERQRPAHREKTPEEKLREDLHNAKETLERGSLEAALAMTTEVIAATKDRQLKAEAYRQRGDIYTQMERSSEALQDYKRVIGLRWSGKFKGVSLGIKRYCAKALKTLLKP